MCPRAPRSPLRRRALRRAPRRAAGSPRCAPSAPRTGPSRPPARCRGPQRAPLPSEVELVDVVRLEGGQRAEHDLPVLADGVLAEPPGGELLALGAGDAPGLQRGGGLPGEVADVLRDPQ